MNIKIFLSSSSDLLEEERDKFPSIINKVQNAFKETCNLQPYIWESNASTFTNSISFQESINEDLKETHLFVFLFCTRLGEHTKEEWEFVSELERTKDVKKILFYKEWYPKFSSLSPDAIKKYAKLQAFLKKFAKEGGFINCFDTIDQFENRLVAQLLIEIPKILKIHNIDIKALAKELAESSLKNQEINSILPISI